MLREFTDSAGTLWRVWDVTPGVRTSGSRTSGSLTRESVLLPAVGWLCFESDQDRRRLKPIPPDWETKDAILLEYYCAKADSVRGTTKDFAPDGAGK